MDDLSLILPLRLAVAIVAAGTTAIAWFAAEDLAYGRSQRQPKTIPNAACVIGWIYAWSGTFVLIAATLFGGAAAATNPQLWTPAPFTLLTGLLMIATVTVVVRASWTIRDALVPSTSPTPATTESSRFLHVSGTTLYSLSLSVVLLILSVILVFAAVIAASNTAQFADEQLSLAVTSAAFVAELLIFAGLTLVSAGEAAKLPDGKLRSVDRRTLSRTLTLLAGLFTVVVAVSLSWFGLVAALLYIVVLVATYGGRRRAAQLAAFWTLANVVRSGRPVESELQQHAQDMRGRARHLLNDAARRLEDGATWGAAICRTGVAPRPTWMELCSAHACGTLADALQAAAARETARFARDGDPGTPRAAIGYFSAVAAIMLLQFSFIGYYIVPKLKRIFEDFGVELPEWSRLSFHVLSGPVVPLASFLVALGLISCGIVGEVFVEAHGWQAAAERFSARRRHRVRTPDLLRGLRWAILRRRPLSTALAAMATAPVNYDIRSKLHLTAAAIDNGQDPWEALKTQLWLTRAEVDLLQSAQAAGNLPWALETLSDAIVARFHHRLEWWLQILHPALILLLGLIVGVFAVAILGPVFSILLSALA